MQRAIERSVAQERLSARQVTLLVLLAHALLAVVMTWPAAARLGTHLAGGREDLFIHQWTFWWIKQALLQGENPFYTTLLYYPNGVSLASHNIAWFNIALWLPLQALFGAAAAYSLVVILVFALNGFTMHLLLYELTESRAAALIGGLIYGFWPYTLSHFDHANMSVIFWVPLVVLYLHRTLKGQRVRDALLAALFLALTGITRWQLLIMSGPILAGYLLYVLLTNKATRTRRTLGLLLLIGLVAAVLMAPLAMPLLINQLASDFPQDLYLDEQMWGRTDLVAYLTPSLYNPLWRDIVIDRYTVFTVNHFYVPFLGYTTLLLALLAVIKQRQARFWLLLALAYVALALGPTLLVNGHNYPQVPMPYRLVQDSFVFRMLRRPDRLNVFLSFPMAVMAAWSVVALQRQRWARRSPAILIGVLAALILIEYAPIPFATTPATIPAWHRRLAQEPGHFGLLEWPINDRHYDKWYMYYQTVHGKPIAVGHVSRLPREALLFLESTPLLRLLANDERPDPALVDVSNQFRHIAAANVRYLVIHKQHTNEAQQLMWRDWITYSPVHEDDEVIVYSTAPQVGRDFKLEPLLTDNIGLIQAQFTPADAIQGGAIKVDARWGSRDAPGQNYDACLHLVDAAGTVAQQHCQPISASWPSSRWQADEVVRSFYVLPVQESLPAGAYTLHLHLAEAGNNTAATAEPVVLGNVTVRSFQPAVTTEACWLNLIQLLGYDLDQSAGALNLTLYWQAQQPTDTSYKVFVHLVDTVTGELVAQSDAVPRNWQYPTSAWEAGEVVHDLVSLPLQDVAPGRYHLWIGLYDLNTGIRLPLTAGNSLQVAQDTLLLTPIER